MSALEESPTRQLVYVIGGNDSGKTTLCRYLSDRLSARFSAAYINCDPGQSTVGPPACLGMALYDGGQAATALRFIGSTTPFRHMLQILNGSARLRDKAVEWGACKVIVDSSGFVYGSAACAFQFESIDLLQPDFVVGIAGSAGERQSLDALMRNFRNGKMAYVRLPVHPAAVKRSAEQRRAYREARFREYFRGARLRTIGFRDLGLHGRIPAKHGAHSLCGRLAAFSDREHFLLALAIIELLDMERKTLEVLAPPFNRKSAATLHFGSLCLDRSGKHSLSYGPAGAV